MTFNQAYKYAMRRSERFRRHDEHAKASKAAREQSACMIFVVDGEAFYYGFDGVDMHKGKHTRRRGKELIDKGEVLIIL